MHLIDLKPIHIIAKRTMWLGYYPSEV